MLAVCIRKCSFAATCAGYFQRKAAAAAEFGALLNRAPAFGAPWRARRLNRSAERAGIGIGLCKFSAVPAWFFVTRHFLFHSFFKFYRIISRIHIECNKFFKIILPFPEIFMYYPAYEIIPEPCKLGNHCNSIPVGNIFIIL
jgi:hypothetical protein